MSTYTSIGDVGETLKRLLEEDPWTGISPKPDISLKSPMEIKSDGSNPNKVSLFLYQIAENIFLKNEDRQRVDQKRLLSPPLFLELYFLITPYSNDPAQEKYILGKVMQILFDTPVLYGSLLQGGIAGGDDEIRILLNPLSLDDLTKLWSAFQDVPFRLSVSYILTPVKLESSREMSVQRVVSKEMDHAYAALKEEVK